MITAKTVETFEPSNKPRGLSEAVAELKREMNVRRRCYPGWIRDGRLEEVDARDRMDRLNSALQALDHIASSDLSAKEAT